MNTFAELQQRLADARFKRSILQYIVDHFDSDFRSVAGQEPKKVLLTDEKARVPAEAFEGVITKAVAEIAELDKEIASILSATVSKEEKKSEETVAPVEKVKKAKKGKEKASERRAEDGNGSTGNGAPASIGTPHDASGEAPVQTGSEETQGAGRA